MSKLSEVREIINPSSVKTFGEDGNLISYLYTQLNNFRANFYSTLEIENSFSPPVPTTEFSSMDFVPLYLVYSWKPVGKVEFYQVQVVKIEDSQETVVQDLFSSRFYCRAYDHDYPFNEPGKYFWRVRAVNSSKTFQSEWSEKNFFSVVAPVDVAVLGDSISHGTSCVVDLGQIACQWQTYCNVPVKNCARGGDTTADMIERFEESILPFQPKFLLIQGGTNDLLKQKANADEIIKNLKILRSKCLENNIKPLYVTILPMNRKKYMMMNNDNVVPEDFWQLEREKVNEWILKNDGADISRGLTDAQGELDENFTIDGLHPELRAKMLIGKILEKYLRTKACW